MAFFKFGKTDLMRRDKTLTKFRLKIIFGFLFVSGNSDVDKNEHNKPLDPRTIKHVKTFFNIESRTEEVLLPYINGYLLDVIMNALFNMNDSNCKRSLRIFFQSFLTIPSQNTFFF